MNAMHGVSGRLITEHDIITRKVDARCRSCGATFAMSSWCYACGSRELGYASHEEQLEWPDATAYWCGKGINRNPPRLPGSSVLPRDVQTGE